MKGTNIGATELTLFKSYEIGLLRIRPLCFEPKGEVRNLTKQSKFFYLIIFLIVYYGSKIQWSNSQKANFIGLNKVSSETPICVPFIWHTSNLDANS